MANEKQISKVQTQEVHSRQSRGYGSNWWPWETLSLAICALSLVAIAVVLQQLDGRPQPNWSFQLTSGGLEKRLSVNSVLSWLSMVARLCLTLTLANSLGQLKWIRFGKSERPLTEFEAFDESTRRVTGSARLIWILRGRSLASIAALTTILTFGLEPFVQNMVTYYPSQTNNTEVARIAIATNYTQHFSTLGVADFEPAMNEAIFSSAFGNNDDLNLPPFFCSSGNCVWPGYSTLTICARCLDLSDRISKSCFNNICNATLPNGYGLGNNSFMYTNATDNFSKDSFQNLSTPFPISVIQLMKALNTTTITSNATIIAAECALIPCVKTFQGSVGFFSGKTQEDLAKDAVNDPNIRETLIDTWDNFTTQGEQDIHYVTISPPSNPYLGIAKGQQFTMSRDALVSLRSGVTLRFLNGVIKWVNGHHQSSSDLADALYKMDNPNCQSHPDGGANNPLICGVQRVADAMTKVIRTDAWDFNSTSAAADMAPGITSVPVTRIKVSWGWLSLPVVVWVLSALVLVGTAWETRRTETPLWKTEALPVLRLRLEPEESVALSEHASPTSNPEEAEGNARYGHLDLNRKTPVMIYGP